MKNLQEEFEIQEGGENETEIKKLLDEIKNNSITISNFKKYDEKHEHMITVISTQIKNLVSQYDNKRKKLDKEMKSDKVKSAMQSKVVPLSVMKTMEDITNLLNEIIGWKIIEAEFSKILAQKKSEGLENAKDMEIESRAIKQMDKMVEENNKLHQNIMDNSTEKFLNALTLLQKENRVERKENNKILCEALKQIGESQYKGMKELAETIEKDLTESINPLKNMLEKVNSQLEKNNTQEEDVESIKKEIKEKKEYQEKEDDDEDTEKSEDEDKEEKVDGDYNVTQTENNKDMSDEEVDKKMKKLLDDLEDEDNEDNDEK